MRILVAEDDQVLADGLLRSLHNAGYAQSTASAGHQADRAHWPAHEFDLLIWIWAAHMPRPGSAAQAARAAHSVPVLIPTATDSVEQRDRGEARPALRRPW